MTTGILITYMGVRCTTDLVGATATVEMGVAGNTAALIALTTATDIDTGEWWQDATPEAGVSPGITAKNVFGNIIITVATAAVTAGVLVCRFFYRPLDATGNMA